MRAGKVSALLVLATLLFLVPAKAQDRGAFRGNWMGTACDGTAPVVFSLAIDGDAAILRGLASPDVGTTYYFGVEAAVTYTVDDGVTTASIKFSNENGSLAFVLVARGGSLGGHATVMTPGTTPATVDVTFTIDVWDGDLAAYLAQAQSGCGLT